MRIAHTVTVTVFCKEHEREERVLQQLKALFPFSLEEEKVPVGKTVARGFEEKKILIYIVVLKKEGQINKFLAFLCEQLGEEQRHTLLEQAPSRLDKDCNFFVRLDKERMLQDGKWIVTDGGNCYHIKMSLAIYPAKWEKGLGAVEKIFK
ncbi:hypothetical protein HYS48_00605 [Candidatus Woesearchaeota archaeon]|nr:hypothetical protein [Candidatus Woesearchaeota archaeon]